MLTISEVTDFLAPQVIHLDWSHLNLAGEGDDDISLNYTLKAVPATDDVLTQAITLLQSNYVFTAPDNAPPCEVYNFSVAATPVGATYTGDGCTTSVSSLVLSRMLPSLPDISMLEASLKHSLKKLPTGKFLLNVSFIVSIINKINNNECDTCNHSITIILRQLTLVLPTQLQITHCMSEKNQ